MGEAPTNPLSTFMLLERALAGDQEAEGELFDDLRRYLLRCARRQTLMQRAAAFATEEDLVDEAFVRVFSSGALGRFGDREPGALRRYLSSVVDSVIVDVLRRGTALKRGGDARGSSLDAEGGSSVTLASRDPSPSMSARVAELERLCEGFLDERETAVWRCTVLDGLSSVEIGAKLGMTPEAVRGVLFRARGRLREGLAKASLWPTWTAARAVACRGNEQARATAGDPASVGAALERGPDPRRAVAALRCSLGVLSLMVERPALRGDRGRRAQPLMPGAGLWRNRDARSVTKLHHMHGRLG